MNTTPTPPPLHATALHLALRLARRAWWSVAIARAVAVAAAAALVVLPAAWALALAANVPGALLPARSVGLALPALAVFALVLIAALGVAAWRAPTLLALARRADRVLMQSECLSTAYEVLDRRDALSTVAAALVDDAERRATSLDWTPVGRAPWWRFAPAVFAAAGAFALAAALVPVPQRSSVPVAATASVPFDADRAARDAATVERFAALLGGVAEQEGSPYLQAVAASFAELAERLEEGTIDAAEASRVLEELVGHLEEAARDVSGRFGDAIEAALARDAAIGAADGAAAGGASGDGGADDAAASAPAGDDGGAAPTPPSGADRGTSDASMYMALQDLANEIANAPGSLGLRSQRPSGVDEQSGADIYGGALQAATDPNAVPAGPSGQLSDAAGAGDAVGAADQSSDRAGDVAGGGSATLGGGADAFLGLEAEGRAVAALPWNERADGRFVEVELVPDAVLGEARAFVRESADGPFRRSDEAASTARSVGAAYRDVVSRYFMPGAVPSGDAP